MNQENEPVFLPLSPREIFELSEAQRTRYIAMLHLRHLRQARDLVETTFCWSPHLYKKVTAIYRLIDEAIKELQNYEAD